jgi:hypothetical protein
LFLQLAAEHVGAQTSPNPKKNIYLMEYFGLVDAKLPGVALAGSHGIERLNTVGNALKHHGVRPSPADIESLRGTVTSFFDDNTPVVFGIRVDELSMSRLVTMPEARSQLEAAEKHTADGKFFEAIICTEEAFDVIASAYHKHRSPPFKKRGVLLRAKSGSDTDVHRLFDLIMGISRFLDDLQDRVDELSLDLETAQVKRFRDLTRRADIIEAGNAHLTGEDGRARLNAGDARFYYDFVIGAALAYQRRFEPAA